MGDVERKRKNQKEIRSNKKSARLLFKGGISRQGRKVSSRRERRRRMLKKKSNQHKNAP